MSNLSQKEKKIKEKKPYNNFYRYTNIASQMIVIILAGTFGGIKLDELFMFSFPFLTVILTSSSVLLATYIAIKDFI